ncbi:MAG: hypothetical protein R8G01_01305 [Ilumatobacteraceae bacterium]|uniref:hypothetical protein n=1 Tax=Ilumatobacter fluminis TaxID=467091 RepID=UPI002969FB9B|nr:hypothetical protein [Ilumatobacteraceae bacterium]
MAWWDDIQWGTVGEWFGGAMAGAAVAYAVVATRSERKRSQENIEAERDLTREAIEIERRRFGIDAAERLAWQARMVTCSAGGRTARKSQPDALIVVARNSSQLPVYDVRAFVVFQGVAHVTPQDESTTVLTEDQSTMVFVGLTIEAAFATPSHARGIAFRDAAGYRWVRYLSGQLLKQIEDLPKFLETIAPVGEPQW